MKVLLSVTDDTVKRLVRIPGHLRELVEARDGFHVTHHSRAHLLVGKRPAQRGHVLDEVVGLVVAGSATVTTGLEITHFRKNADQLWISSSLAKSGSGRPSTILCRRAFSSGMLMLTAVP